MSTTARVNPFHVALMHFIRGLAKLPAPVIDAVPEAAQIESVAEFITAVARLGDQFMRACGDELRSNAPVPMRLENWQSPFFDSIDGYALYDIACIAEDSEQLGSNVEEV